MFDTPYLKFKIDKCFIQNDSILILKFNNKNREAVFN